MKFFVYILECADKTFYIGWTNDIQKRVLTHNISKQGAKYTKARRPVSLKYQEEQPDLSHALKREAALKRLSREQKIALINSKKI